MTKEERRWYFYISAIILIIITGLIINERKSYYLKNGTTTTGRVIDFHFCNNNYCGTYEYIVDGKKYEGSWSGSFFRCPNGAKGCVGKEFPVYYSVENPSISEIYLKEFDIKKN
ncbi:hypothetical protein [Flagellimonas sp. S3867]|uniref:hypothetical protein n=1 Tax=Flagellimonas sp. S3867 TaxID=2768063 RepID=UPI001684BCAB|nr:hypothetical protein [Flagellimonas sp. S3867]